MDAKRADARPVVAVIGAGMGGLCAARALRRSGQVEVVVYERGDAPGGVLHTSYMGGFAREHAANGFLPVRDGSGAIDLARELGVEVVEAAPAAKKRWIYRHGKLRALPSSPVELVTTDLLSWRGKLAALAEPLRRPREDGDESVFAFARRRLGAEVAEAIVAPFVTGVFAGNADELSVRAGFPTLAALEAEGGLVVGQLRATLRRMREARRAQAGAPGPQRPASKARLRLAAPAGGVQALVDALAGDLGDALVTGAAVTAVRPGPRPTLVLADGSEREVDAVVLATPAHASAELVAAAAPELSQALAAFPYAPIAIVHMGVRRADVAHPLDGFGFLVARDEDLRMLGTVFESVLWSDRAPPGHVLLRCMFGGARDPAAVELDDQALIDTARRDLDKALGGFAAVELVHTNVVRWPRAIAQYTLGHDQRVARAEALAQPLGITLAGSAYHGVAVNRIVADARRVVSEVLRQVGAAAALCLAVLLVACAGGNKAASDSLAPEAAPAAERSMDDRGDLGVDRAAVRSGRVKVAVTWAGGPAALRRPAGRTPCGTWRHVPVSVHTLGGVQRAVVRLEGPGVAGMDAGRASAEQGAGEEAGDAPGADPTEIEVRGCRLEPRVVVLPRAGAELVIRNHDEQRHRVTVKPAHDSGAPGVEARLPLIGSRVAVPMAEPGVWQVALADEPEHPSYVPSYVIVPAHPYVALTDARGQVRFDDVPAGAYEAVVWHPPAAAGAPGFEARRPIAVAGDELTAATLSLRAH